MDRASRNTYKSLTKQDLDITLEDLRNHGKATEHVMMFGSSSYEAVMDMFDKQRARRRLIETLKNL